MKIYFDSDFVTFLSHGYKVILENEATIDPVQKKVNMKDMFNKMNNRLHKGGKYDNVLGEVSSMRVRTSKSSYIDKVVKREIQGSAWARRVLIPFNCDNIVNTKGISDEYIKAGLYDNETKLFDKSKIDKSMVDQLGRKRDNFKAFSEEVVNDQEDIDFTDPEFENLKDFEVQNILLGIDPHEKVSKHENLMYEKALESTKNILDFSYYYMGEKAFLALIDVLEEEKNVGALQIQGNNLTDKAIINLCRSLEDVHHSAIELIDVSENIDLTDDSATALSALVDRLPNLQEIKMEG